ncbi:MAG: isopentenyl-diphosphate delta-isomerase [Candidatus Peregrinibacteria bacterium Greene0416_19]|nr:MAG: isopentenyl-diphosphate delta-isomerase [Candidatus Peregrinibacteria bacterium Greene0416_19]
MPQIVILSNEAGSPYGTADLLEAHTGQGKLHKAFSVYVFRKAGSEILIQQRSAQKMLWPLIWANTCCSHPFEGETPSQAGERRLQEELGFTTPLTEQGTFVYRAEDPGRGVEHEHVTILTGETDGADIRPDPAEVAAWKWISLSELAMDMEQNPDQYAPWFHRGLRHIIDPS